MPPTSPTTTGVAGAPENQATLRSPFPWFGGKAKVADVVWQRFGNPSNYVEPFAGSLAVLLARPDTHEWWSRNETVNDLDGNIANWHRSIAADPAAVAFHASQPVNEIDLTSRHLWLVTNAEAMRARLFADPDFYDARAAGWWVWGISAWVGGDWCTGIGPYTGTDEPSLTNGGTSPGVYRKSPMCTGAHGGKGIHKPIPLALCEDNTAPEVIAAYQDHLSVQFHALGNRMRRVRVASGDWSRVLGNAAVPAKRHVTGVLLDPPYDPTERRSDLYAVGDRSPSAAPLAQVSVHEAARTWALDRTDDATYRIAYCSYSNPDEDALFDAAGWTPYRWAAAGGYAHAAKKAEGTRAQSNKYREIVWFSPSCLSDAASVSNNEPTDTPNQHLAPGSAAATTNAPTANAGEADQPSLFG
jgi:DNA adenine methylase